MKNYAEKVKLSQAEIEALIERYFDCLISDAEEKLLKSELAKCQYRSPIIDEALVAIGFFEVGRRRTVKATRNRGNIVALRVASVAASVAVIIAIVMNFVPVSGVNEDNYCIAYVNGQEVNDDAVVLELMRSELAGVNEASKATEETITMQLSAFKGIIK